MGGGGGCCLFMVRRRPIDRCDGAGPAPGSDGDLHRRLMAPAAPGDGRGGGGAPSPCHLLPLEPLDARATTQRETFHVTAAFVGAGCDLLGRYCCLRSDHISGAFQFSVIGKQRP